MDKIEFEKYFLSCKTALERFVYYKIHSKSDGEDIIQEVAVSAFKNAHTLSNPQNFKSWILKIAANKCNDYYRNLAKRYEIPLDDLTENIISKNRYGISDMQVVRDTLNNLTDKDNQILYLYYFKNKPQAEIAELLKIPVGTVKSRLHTAKQNFKETYPFPPKSKDLKESKGDTKMKTLPDIMPEYKITQSAKAPFEVKWEESPGWFIVPKLGEKITWAMYEFADKKRLETVYMEVRGKASVHGIEGVEIVVLEKDAMEWNATDDGNRGFVAQLTDTHCRFLGESYMHNGVKIYHTFLDGDKFNMEYGDDNCGKEINIKQNGIIKKSGNEIVCPNDKPVVDIVGRYDVEINGKIYDTVCFTDIVFYNPGVFSEQYIDKNGKTVLWRRFNKNDWKYQRYNEHYNFKDKLWNEMFPGNEQVIVNGEIYVHWYDCLTDYIF